MIIFDHIVLLVLVLIKPVEGAWSFNRHVRRFKAGDGAKPAQLYRATLIEQWIALAIFLPAWLWLQRPLSDLGFVSPEGWGFWLALVLTAGVCAALAGSWRAIRALDDEKRRKAVAGTGDLVYFFPRDGHDAAWFNALSVTAGIVEEIIYRGFLFWYFAHFLPTWGVVVASSIVFALGHLYQGPSGAIRVGLLGLGFALLYWLSGSIWVPIIAHILVDALQGKSMQLLLTEKAH